MPPAAPPDLGPASWHGIPPNRFNAHCWITGQPQIGEGAGILQSFVCSIRLLKNWLRSVFRLLTPLAHKWS